MTFPSLPPSGEVHLWLLPHRPHGTELLCREERERMGRYRFEKERERYTFTQSSLRMILARYLHRPPADLVFTHNGKGKPAVAELEFNLSHTESLSVLAVTTGQAVGVDIERVLKRDDRDDLARHITTVSEWEALQSLPEAEQTLAFYRLWTAKEAYLKNLGIGLEVEPKLVESDFPQINTITAPGHPTRILLEIAVAGEFCLHLASERNVSELKRFHFDDIFTNS